MNCFIKWQKWTDQFPEFNATSAGEIYVILYMLSLFENNKSNPVIRMLYQNVEFSYQNVGEFFTEGRELGNLKVNY